MSVVWYILCIQQINGCPDLGTLQFNFRDTTAMMWSDMAIVCMDVKKELLSQSYCVSGIISQDITLSTQPIGGFDWHPDKAGLAVCSSYDQTLRVLIVTKLARL